MWALAVQFSASEAQVEELRRQVGTLEGLLQEEQREMVALQDSFTHEAKLLKDSRAKLDQVRRADEVRAVVGF